MTIIRGNHLSSTTCLDMLPSKVANNVTNYGEPFVRNQASSDGEDSKKEKVKKEKKEKGKKDKKDKREDVSTYSMVFHFSVDLQQKLELATYCDLLCLY